MKSRVTAAAGGWAGLALLTAWLLLGIAPSSGSALDEGPHDFSDVGCDFCHLGEPGDSPLRAGMDALCAECHDACRDGRKHVGEPAAGSAMRVELPLAEGGVIGCATCHDPHGPDLGRESFLRIRNAGRRLCLNCHRVGDQEGTGAP